MFVVALFLVVPKVQAQELTKPLDYQTGKVSQILEEKTAETDGALFYVQKVQVKLKSGELAEIEVGSEFQPLTEQQRLVVGREVIVAIQSTEQGDQYVLADVYRIPTLVWLFVGFVILVIVVAKWQGLSSVLGMAVSLGVLSGFIVPQIMQGANPMLISLIGAAIIAVVTIYLSHGWHRESHLALFSMMFTLFLVSVLSTIAVQVAQLVGLGSEEAYFLQFGPTAAINLQGLMLGGIVLGALGILDDICVSQIATVQQLKEVNSDLGFDELYKRGLNVGKSHVASLVNTLVLAYAAANLPLFILFTLNNGVPLWVTINSEIIAEEVLRTLVGSMGLVIAVPVATAAAAWFMSRPGVVKASTGKTSRSVAHRGHSHQH